MPEGEEHKHGAGKHGGGGKGPEEDHGKPGHKHEGGPGGPGGRPGRRGGKRGQKGKKRPEDEEDTSDEDEDEAEEDDDDDCADDDEEEKNPGLRRAGRVAGRAWKRKNGIEGKIKNMTPEQKKEIRKIKREARIAFRKSKA